MFNTMPSHEHITHAVIYARVSSKAQTKRTDGLSSQVAACLEYARNRNWDVTEIFKDDISGRLEQRPGMKSMLSYLRQNKEQSYAVIIDDVSRLARSLEAHRNLRKMISKAGAVLVSPNIEFAESADSQLHESMFALFAEHQSLKNAEQTVNRMRGAMLRGHWPFHFPVGYKRGKVNGLAKGLMRDEPVASIIEQGLNDFASGVIQTQSEFCRYLEQFPHYPKGKNGKVHQQRVKDLLTNTLYAGYLKHDDWNVPLTKAIHEPLISFSTYQKIQERLQEGAYLPTHKSISQDFPLRGAVVCGDCGNSLTANWSKSKTGKKHPYYICRTKGCAAIKK
jgi:DNA invertase Pin-like site-specific DNA recombinase